MVDNFSLALAHILLGIMVWRLLAADCLDREDPSAPVDTAQPQASAKADRNA